MEKPNFTPNDTPLSDEQLTDRETWMMEEGNWRDDHSVPSVGEHYRYMWKWDSYKGIVINARRGDPERAETEMFALENYRDPATGFLSNKIFATADHKTWRDYPEAWNFNNNKIGTSYSQPPIAAWAAIETYNSYKNRGDETRGLDFLHRIYGTAEEGRYTGLRGEYAYFINHRQNSKSDPLIGIVHPNETGRDSDEANKPWLARAEKQPGALREWLHMQKFGHDIGRLGRDKHKQRIDWIPEQVRQKYWVNDVMFNAMHANNLRHLATIADTLQTDDGEHYRTTADNIEHEILTRMWDSDSEFFYNLDENGEQIDVRSITGLFPLLLENIEDEQVDALLDKLEDLCWFNTRYPIPTHAVRSKFNNPNAGYLKNALTPQWSRPVWIDTNMILTEEGLVARANDYNNPEHVRYDPERAKRLLGRAGVIATRTKALLANNPKSMECYDPDSGEGMRVEDFMWSNLGLHFDNFHKTTQS